MTERLYPELKRRLRERKHLLPSERDFIDRVERIAGYEVSLPAPAGASYILGVDDAEGILRRITPSIDGETQNGESNG